MRSLLVSCIWMCSCFCRRRHQWKHQHTAQCKSCPSGGETWYFFSSKRQWFGWALSTGCTVVLDGFCWSPPPLWWQVGSSLLSPSLGRSKELELSSIWWDCWLLFPKLYPTLSSSERKMHPKQLLWAFWLVHDIYKDGFELVWTQQFRTSKYWIVLVQKFALTGPDWMETKLPESQSAVQPQILCGYRCKLMRTLCDQRMGVHGSSTGKSGAIWCKFLKFLA